MSLKRIRQSGASVRSSRWSIRNLEKREMLAADVAQVDLATCESMDDGLAVENSDSGPTQLVFVDSTVEGASELIQGLQAAVANRSAGRFSRRHRTTNARVDEIEATWRAFISYRMAKRASYNWGINW
ncbi:MAG: hypothetical protein R3C28_10380 [Pirellulaceae bacterium]